MDGVLNTLSITIPPQAQFLMTPLPPPSFALFYGPNKVWNAGCNLSIAFLVSFICFYKCLRGVLLNPTWVPIQFAHTFPLLLLFYMLLCFLVSAAALTLAYRDTRRAPFLLHPSPPPSGLRITAFTASSTRPTPTPALLPSSMATRVQARAENVCREDGILL